MRGITRTGALPAWLLAAETSGTCRPLRPDGARRSSPRRRRVHPELTLDPIVGSTEVNVVDMAYDSGASSGAEMVFTYTVAAQDRASDSALIDDNALKLNRATIQDGEGNNADITHASYFPVSAPDWEYHQVDGSKTNSDSQQGGV